MGSWLDSSLWWGAVLWAVGCYSSIPGPYPQKCLQTLSKVPWGGTKSLPVEITHTNGKEPKLVCWGLRKVFNSNALIKQSQDLQPQKQATTTKPWDKAAARCPKNKTTKKSPESPNDTQHTGPLTDKPVGKTDTFFSYKSWNIMEKEEKTKEKRGKKSEMRNRGVGKMLWNRRRGGGKSELNFPPGSEACPWSLRG